MNKISKKSKKVRKGDTVIAISGNNRGQSGVVMSCSGDKVLVQGLNVRKKHVKPSQQNQKGGIIDLEKPIHISNLKVCAADQQPVKLKVRITKKGERELVYNQDGKDILHRSIKKSKQMS